MYLEEQNLALELSPNDQFFQELRALSEPLVNQSMMMLLAYQLKSSEAKAYLVDPSLEYPYFKKEAELRKVTMGDLAKSIVQKEQLLLSLVREFELLRVEFNLIAAKSSSYEDRMSLRNRLIVKARSLTNAINS